MRCSGPVSHATKSHKCRVCLAAHHNPHSRLAPPPPGGGGWGGRDSHVRIAALLTRMHVSGEPAAPDIRTPSKKDRRRRKKLEARLTAHSATWKNEFDFLALDDIQGYHCQYCVLANANSRPSDQLSTGYKLNADTKLPNPIPSKQILEQHSHDERHKQNQSKGVDQLRQEADPASPPPPLLSPCSSFQENPSTMQHLAPGGGGEGLHTFDDSSYRETQHDVLAMSDPVACSQQERHCNDYNKFRNKLHNTEWCQKYRDTNLIQSHGVTDMSQMTTPRLSVTIDAAAPKIYALDNSTVAAAKDGGSSTTTTKTTPSNSCNNSNSSSSGGGSSSTPASGRAGQCLAGISAPTLSHTHTPACVCVEERAMHSRSARTLTPHTRTH